MVDTSVETHAPEVHSKESQEATPEKPLPVPVSEMFKHADRTDIILMIVGGIAAFVNGAGLPAFSIVFGNILGELAVAGASVEESVRRLAITMVIIGAVVFVLSSVQVGTWMVSSIRQVRRIRQKFFMSCLRQDMAWHDEHKPGELTAMMDGDTRVIMNGINDKASSGIFQLGMALFGFGVGFYQSWQLTLVMLGMMPFIAMVGALMSYVMTKLTERSREGYARAGEIATELLENIRTVQVFGQEDRDVDRFTAALKPAQTAGIKREFVSVGSVGLTYFVMFGSYALAFWFASYLVVKGLSDISKITGTFFAVLMGSFAVGLVFPSISSFAEARGAARKIYAICDRLPSIDVFGGGAEAPPIAEGITFRDVAFRYPSRRDQPLLEKFNVCIPRGRKVAFSGPSGCGKSTIIALLQRFYDPDSGTVEIDGVDLKSLDVRKWRDCIGVVSQEPSLFMGTIEENVKIGKPDASREEVIDACKKAQIHDVVMTLSEGYDTPVGNVGSQLSGGQKQRIAIARAIIRSPRILLLDEATSALDRKSEMDVQQTLDEVMRSETGESLTVIVIAHRLATIRSVDQIYFMETDGEKGSSIAEAGTFAELMNLKGKFAAMAARQDATAKAERTEADAEVEAAQQSSSFAMTREKSNIEIAAEKEVADTPVPWLRVLSLNGPNCQYIILGLIGSVITGLVYPAYALVLAEMLEVLGRTENLDQVAQNSKLWSPMFVVIGGSSLIGWMLQGMYSVAGERLTTLLRRMLLAAVLRQEIAFFDVPGRDPGAVAAVLSGDTESVRQLWGPSLGFKIQSICNLAGGIVLALVFNWRIALVVLSVAPAIALAGALQQLLLVGFGHESAGANEDSVKSEALSNIRTVASFNLQQNRIDIYANKLQGSENKSVTTGLITGIAFGFSQFALYAVFALGFWYGGRLLQRGEATFREILIATMGVLMGAMGAGEAGGFAAKVADAQTASKKVFAFIDRVPRIDVDCGGEVNANPSPTVGLSEVEFRYPARPQMPVLRGVTEQFSFGTQIGLMGQTGCGKSTIIQLLTRFYDPDNGAVVVDGVDLRQLDLRQWRSNISIVMQEPALFSGSVRENILYGRPDATDDEVFEAARLAHIHDDVLAMPKGYDTNVGYRGRELSGGQKQRVAIARALIRRPKLLLLDEATSALDNATEIKVQQGLDEYRSTYPMTTISVAHRLTTIHNSDAILVMDKGRVIERGSHSQLMARGGEYKTRYDLFTMSH